MDVNKIFGLFESGSNPDEKNLPDVVFIDFKDTPVYWVGMFKKLIHNHKTFTKQVINLFEQSDPLLDPKALQDTGDMITYEKAWFYISKLDINNKVHKESLVLVTDQILIKTLNASILYFQSIEYYERCAFIKKILDEVKKF